MLLLNSSCFLRRFYSEGDSLCHHECEYGSPSYGEILKIAETKPGRCSELSMLFGAMLSSLGLKDEKAQLSKNYNYIND